LGEVEKYLGDIIEDWLRKYVIMVILFIIFTEIGQGTGFQTVSKT
jgi:hypothetical protein